MATREGGKDSGKSAVTIEDVNRVLEVGRILLSVLTPQELAELPSMLNASILALAAQAITAEEGASRE